MVEMLKCSICEKEITYIDKTDEIFHHTHFNIIRSNKEFIIEDDCIEVDGENIKMEIVLCEDCFLKVLNESKTLGDLFFDKSKNMFIY